VLRTRILGTDKMIQFAAFALSAAFSAAIIIGIFPLLVRYALARPNARSSHKRPTPLGGGIAVVAAVLGVTSAMILLLPIADAWPAFAVLAGTSVALAAARGCGMRTGRLSINAQPTTASRPLQYRHTSLRSTFYLRRWPPQRCSGQLCTSTSSPCLPGLRSSAGA
jgi:hypothetical protein